MKAILTAVAVLGAWYAVEIGRGMPPACHDSLERLGACARMSIDSVYRNTGNPWPAATAYFSILDMQQSILAPQQARR